MTSGQHVVIVDGVPETAEVLREVFEPRGHRVDRIRSFDSATTPTERSVLVVHDDAASDVDRRFKYGTVPRIVIGTITTEDVAPSPGDERRLSQPFQYAELIRAVEELLAEPPSRRAA
ncbi:MAG: hypothetical protein WBC44_19095 [Planctomycetaceae bacterium]